MSGSGDRAEGAPSGVATSIDGEWSASCMSRATFGWANPLIALGHTRPLQHDDLGLLGKEDSPGVQEAVFQRAWRAELARVTKQVDAMSPPPADHAAEVAARVSMWRVMWGSFLPAVAVNTVYAVTGNALEFVPPLCLEFIIKHVETVADGTADDWSGIPAGYWLVLFLVLSLILQNLCWEKHLHCVLRQGMRAQQAMMATIYAKSIRLSNASRNSTSAGKITNLYAGDALQLRKTVVRLSAMVSAPLIIITSLTLLVRQVGAATFVGLLVLLVVTPAQVRMGKVLRKLQKKTLKFADKRLKLVGEIVKGVRVIKFHAWEGSFAQRCMAFRDLELKNIRFLKYLTALYDSLIDSAMVLVAVATFLTYGLVSEEQLTPSKAFTALALLHIMAFPLNVLVNTVNFLIACNVSLDRLKSFLLLDELKVYVVDEQAPFAGPITSGGAQLAIAIEGGSFAWDAAGATAATTSHGAAGGHGSAAAAEVSTRKLVATTAGAGAGAGAAAEEAIYRPFVLSNIDFTVAVGTLHAVVGPVGAGKSSLLGALLGDIELLEGTVRRYGRVAYCSQVPWVMNTTLRENILFGEPYEEHRYNVALYICALDADVKSLPAGDMTEIGARGVTLSGGQKARVALARAIYADADTYILDDVLSAVDAHTGRHVFRHCIQGWMRGERSFLGVEAERAPPKSRVLVTHHMHYVTQADAVTVLDDSVIVASGSWAEVKKTGIDVESLVSQERRSLGDADGGDGEAEGKDGDESKAADVSGVAVKVVGDSKVSADPSATAGGEDLLRGGKHGTAKGKGKLTQKEERVTGSVKASIYLRYLMSCGLVFGSLTLLLRAGTSGLLFANDWALSQWSVMAGDRSMGFYVAQYGILAASSVLVTLFYYVSWAVASTQAAASLHHQMFHRLLRAPTSFFDVTPAGRILNRFSGDTGTIDTKLSVQVSHVLRHFTSIIVILIIEAAAVPWLLLGFIPALLVYATVQNYYRRTSREVQRLDSIAKSPVFSHMAETLNGVTSVRAYGMQDRFQLENLRRLRRSFTAFWAGAATNRWLGVRLNWIGSSIILVACLVCVAWADVLGAGFVGLVLTYSVRITGHLMWLVRNFTATESAMNSVERVLHYGTEIPVEADAEVPDTEPPASWPSRGTVVVKNLRLRYRPELPLVLRDLDINVKAGEKVGIVGRTGSGKSTLMLALCRIVEPSSGSITLDGVDISTIGLHTLRSRISVIPQDPTLFSGTVRYNLDPTGESKDEALWEALERVGLKDFVTTRLPHGLDSDVAEGGESVSVGQRQLFCMARAFLSKAKVLIMDEATASVDRETDALLQTVVREVFADCTTLTIAHRLDTVMDSDKVLVMDSGAALEFDSPDVLMAKEGGAFAQLVREHSSMTW